MYLERKKVSTQYKPLLDNPKANGEGIQ